MIYAGIDNGTRSGAICIISGSLIIDCFTLPVTTLNKEKVLDVEVLWQWIVDTVQTQNLDKLIVMVEKPGGAKSYKAAVSMASCFHSVRAMLDLKRIKWEAVTPQKWQKQMLACKSGDTKPAALKLASKLWPNETWLSTPRSKKPHTGLVDAALIAEYNRRTNQ